MLMGMLMGMKLTIIELRKLFGYDPRNKSSKARVIHMAMRDNSYKLAGYYALMGKAERFSHISFA